MSRSRNVVRRTPAQRPRRKYRNEPCELDGHRFASKRERDRYIVLKTLQKTDRIFGLALQPRLPITIKGVKVGTYVADFTYAEKGTGRIVWEDVKGVRTPLYRLKKKLVEAIYDIRIDEI